MVGPLIAASPAPTQGDPSSKCEGLASLTLPGGTIASAQTVAAGAFTYSGGPGARSSLPQQQVDALKTLPAFCRVQAALAPSSDSDIKIEVWLPLTGWNGKYQAVGNGGWTGSIAYAAMVEALRRGYATSSTDTGHSGGSASFALGHPEKVIDFGYRSVHLMTGATKSVVDAFYGTGPRLSYWSGCSAGGRQGLKEAQRFPGDFDGIVAGAPAADWTGRATQAIRIAQALHKDEASYIPPAKYALVHNAVLEVCDAVDGVKDGVLENPTQCRFDPAVLRCKGAEDSSCLTAPQVEAARTIYSSLVNPRTKREIAGLQPGSELGWATWGGPQPLSIAFDHFKYIVFKDPSWDFHAFDATTDVAKVEEADAGLINALDPNLKPFFERGGKLIQYHGWSDPQISPGNSVAYYKSVLEGNGGLARVQAAYRLFMVPGMAHCGGGDGTSSFDAVAALEQWVEKKQAPEMLLASRIREGKVDRTRPLCPYPQMATYKGTGNTDEAASFLCR
jgi:feruloyl esterase